MAKIILFIFLEISLFARVLNYKFLSPQELYVYTKSNTVITIKRGNRIDVFKGNMVLIDLNNLESVKIEALEDNRTIDALEFERELI